MGMYFALESKGPRSNWKCWGSSWRDSSHVTLGNSGRGEHLLCGKVSQELAARVPPKSQEPCLFAYRTGERGQTTRMVKTASLPLQRSGPVKNRCVELILLSKSAGKGYVIRKYLWTKATHGVRSTCHKSGKGWPTG